MILSQDENEMKELLERGLRIMETLVSDRVTFLPYPVGFNIVQDAMKNFYAFNLLNKLNMIACLKNFCFSVPINVGVIIPFFWDSGSKLSEPEDFITKSVSDLSNGFGSFEESLKLVQDSEIQKLQLQELGTRYSTTIPIKLLTKLNLDTLTKVTPNPSNILTFVHYNWDFLFSVLVATAYANDKKLNMLEAIKLQMSLDSIMNDTTVIGGISTEELEVPIEDPLLKIVEINDIQIKVRWKQLYKIMEWAKICQFLSLSVNVIALSKLIYNIIFKKKPSKESNQGS